MKYFTGLLTVFNSSNEMINSLPVTALAKRSRFKPGVWKYTVRVGLAYDLDDHENTSVFIYTENEWKDAVKAAIVKECEHDNVEVSIREVII